MSDVRVEREGSVWTVLLSRRERPARSMTPGKPEMDNRRYSITPQWTIDRKDLAG